MHHNGTGIASPFHSTSLLLVEDNPADIRLTVELLREAKLANRLQVIRDGREALQYLRHEGVHAERPMPDIVLLDLDLPGSNGRDVLAEIRGTPMLRHLPVFVLTASVAHAEAVRAEGLNADGFLIKPLDLPQFLQAVCTLDRFWLELVCSPPGA